jgi:hypothetical protein
MYGRYKFDGVTQRTLSSVANLYMKFSSTSDLFHELTTTTTTNSSSNNTSNGGNSSSRSSDNVNSRGDDILVRLNNNNTHPRSSIYSLIDNPLATSNNSSNTTPAKSPLSSSSSSPTNNNNNYKGESKGTDVVGGSTDIGIYSPLGAYEEDGDNYIRNGVDNDDNDDGNDDDDDEFDMSKMTTSEEASIFRGIDRLKIIYDILISKTDHCCKLDIRKLLKHKCIVALMPMHDLVDVYNLQLHWLTFFTPPWKQPNTLIRNYFGKYKYILLY